jgi:hypothetical protein
MKIAVIVLVPIVGLWLLVDSLTFALSPPDRITGRAKGCYTSIESILGFSEPSDQLRQAQSWVGGTLSFGVPMAFIARRRSGRGR